MPAIREDAGSSALLTTTQAAMTGTRIVPVRLFVAEVARLRALRANHPNSGEFGYVHDIFSNPARYAARLPPARTGRLFAQTERVSLFSHAGATCAVRAAFAIVRTLATRPRNGLGAATGVAPGTRWRKSVPIEESVVFLGKSRYSLGRPRRNPDFCWNRPSISGRTTIEHGRTGKCIERI